MQYTKQSIAELNRIERLIFINSLSGYKCPCLIGTTDGKGTHNLAIFNSVMHIGSNPALLGLIMRPLTVERHTYNNIISTGHYTINHVHTGILKQAHQTSANYPADVDEFEMVGLTPQFMNGCPSPFVGESRVSIGLSLEEEIDVKSNGTKLLVGKIELIDIPDGAQREDGSLDLVYCDTVAVSGLHSYYKTELLERHSYARPDSGFTV